MPLYLCLVPNQGARIGHQSWEYIVLVNYCKKFGFIFVFHEFLAKSKIMGNVIDFGSINKYKFTDPFIQSMKRVSFKDLEKADHNALIELHKREENILLHDRIGGNEHFMKHLPYRMSSKEEQEMQKEYSEFFKNKYPRKVEGPYICFHIRRGDVADRKGRCLDANYFIEKYKYLLTKIPETNLPVYAITEHNFTEDEVLKENIPEVQIIRGSEVDAFYYLVNSTYLVASGSGFSNLAHFLGSMKIVVPPLWRFLLHNRI